MQEGLRSLLYMLVARKLEQQYCPLDFERQNEMREEGESQHPNDCGKMSPKGHTEDTEDPSHTLRGGR